MIFQAIFCSYYSVSQHSFCTHVRFLRAKPQVSVLFCVFFELTLDSFCVVVCFLCSNLQISSVSFRDFCEPIFRFSSVLTLPLPKNEPIFSLHIFFDLHFFKATILHDDFHFLSKLLIDFKI